MLEANEVHLEAEAIQAQIEPEIRKIDSLRNLLVTKNTSRTDSLANDLSRQKIDFEDWEKNFFPVPGFEHAHEKGHEHHHDHPPAPELPADKMLEIQKEIKMNIERIKTDLNQTLAATKEMLN